MAMVVMGDHSPITATVDPVALVLVGVIPIEDAGAVGVTGDPIHLHGSDTLNGSPRSSVDLMTFSRVKLMSCQKSESKFPLSS